jgi:hypothetical protein
MSKIGWVKNKDPPPSVFLHKKVTKLTEENHELFLEVNFL